MKNEILKILWFTLMILCSLVVAIFIFILLYIVLEGDDNATCYLICAICIIPLWGAISSFRKWRSLDADFICNTSYDNIITTRESGDKPGDIPTEITKNQFAQISLITKIKIQIMKILWFILGIFSLLLACCCCLVCLGHLSEGCENEADFIYMYIIIGLIFIFALRCAISSLRKWRSLDVEFIHNTPCDNKTGVNCDKSEDFPLELETVSSKKNEKTERFSINDFNKKNPERVLRNTPRGKQIHKSNIGIVNHSKDGLRFASISSGASGNASILFTNDEALAIDIGLSKKELYKGYAQVSCPTKNLVGILITHEHKDHILGLTEGFKSRTPTFISPELYHKYYQDCLEFDPQGNFSLDKKTFEYNRPFFVGKFSVIPFKLPHDSLSCVGYVVGYKNIRFGYATDFGFMPNSAKKFLRNCDALLLDCCYDANKIGKIKYDENYKNRVKGEKGHIDNAMAMSLLPELITERTKIIFLAHISLRLNSLHLVEEACKAQLKSMNRTDIKYYLLYKGNTISVDLT